MKNEFNENVQVVIAADSQEEYDEVAKAILGDNCEFFDVDFSEPVFIDSTEEDCENCFDEMGYDYDIDAEIPKYEDEDSCEFDFEDCYPECEECEKEHEAKLFESFNLAEWKEFTSLCDKLGIRTIDEAVQFAENIVGSQVADRELLDILREAAVKQNTKLSYLDKLKLLDYNNALRLAKETNAIYAYGYSKNGKFVEIDPIKLERSEIEFERGFKDEHPDCEVLYFAYPDKSFMAEAAKDTLSITRNEEEKPVKRDLKILERALSEAMDDLDDFTVDSQCDEFDVDCVEEELTEGKDTEYTCAHCNDLFPRDQVVYSDKFDNYICKKCLDKVEAEYGDIEVKEVSEKQDSSSEE